MAKNIHEFQTMHSEEVQELSRQLADKDRVISEYRKEHGKLEVFFRRISEQIKPIKPIESVYVHSNSKPEVKSVMRISDAHMGEIQEADEIEGFNYFDHDVCRTRQVDYANRFNRWIDRHREGYSIPDVHVLVTGDLISGDIHDELRVTNAFPVPVQIVKAAEVLAEQLMIVSANFSNVIVEFLVADNHARLTKKPQAKEEGYNSYNYVVGKLAEQFLSKHTNIKFNIHPTYEKVVEVGSRRYLICHGHGVMSWMGVPWYAIERKVGREALNRMRIAMEDESRKLREIGFHKYVFGHYHTPIDTDMYTCCGSVSGTNAHDKKNGRYSLPSQQAWLVGEHGEFDLINFKL